MFFDRRNCRRVRHLEGICKFLETAITQLEELEKDTLKEIENSSTVVADISSSTINDDCIVVNNTSSSTSDCIITTNVSSADLTPSSVDPQTSRNFEGGVSSKSPFKRESTVQEEEDELREGKRIKTIEMVQVKKEPNCVEHSVGGSNDSFNYETVSHVFKAMSTSSSAMESNTVDLKDNINLCVKGEAGTDPLCYPKKINIENPEFQAVVKFKTRLNWNEVEHILEKNGVRGIIDILVQDRKANITFLSKHQLQTLLKLNNKVDLKKLSAFSIQQLKKFTLHETTSGISKEFVPQQQP